MDSLLAEIPPVLNVAFSVTAREIAQTALMKILVVGTAKSFTNESLTLNLHCMKNFHIIKMLTKLFHYGISIRLTSMLVTSRTNICTM